MRLTSTTSALRTWLDEREAVNHRDGSRPADRRATLSRVGK